MRTKYRESEQPIEEVAADAIQGSWRVVVKHSNAGGVWIGTSANSDDDCTGPRIRTEDWNAIVHAVNNGDWGS